MAAHTDCRFAVYITQGVQEGFCIGFDYTSRRESASHKMRSTIEHPEAVYRYLEDKCSKGRALGPFPPASVPQEHVNRHGVVPNKGIDKWHLILDLSSLEQGYPQRVKASGRPTAYLHFIHCTLLLQPRALHINIGSKANITHAHVRNYTRLYVCMASNHIT